MMDSRSIKIPLHQREYHVDIGRASRKRLHILIDELSDVNKSAIIADQHVADLHLDALLAAIPMTPRVLTVPPGEASKSLQCTARLYEGLAEARIERNDLIITFGGGVAGDLGGFVAATWLRGIRFIQVPTTLEAAVDASIGGKTGVNTAAGKNLVGAFHQPSAVVIDIEFLATLPDRDFAAGLAESVKHGAIRDAAFLAWHEQHADAIRERHDRELVELIARNCEIKGEVVARDEREQDLRAILNHGHTIGHALEHLLGYDLRHGECVALGMIAENELACRRGRLAREQADRIRTLLERLGLPTRLPRPVPPERIAEAAQMDKKVRGGRVNYILLRELGRTERVADVSSAEIAAAVDAIQPA